MEKIKISQLEEKLDVEGVEMIPVQIGDLNYKISVDTIVSRSRDILHAYKAYAYDELKQLKDSNLLIPGEQYLLTDYQCIYIQPVTDEIITCDFDGWQLMLLATSENTFDTNVSVYFTDDSTYIANGGKPIKECTYIFDNFENYIWADTTSKGVIIDLTDFNYNRCSYDFKHIKFRRWALKDVTENDTVGATNQPACYRCYGTADEPKRSDGRSWVGSGLEIEKQYIKSIFAGTFNNVMWGQPVLHNEYITKVHKPFMRTDDNLQYVAYNTTLDDLSALTDAKPHLAKYQVDETDYIDCYTFECNGVDISNWDGVIRNYVSRGASTQLPNIVILVENTYGDKIKSNFYQNEIEGFSSTFAIHQIDNYSPAFQRNKIFQTNNSLWNVFRFYNNRFNQVANYNYVSGSMHDCTVEEFGRNVLFGCFQSVSFKNSNYNLLFGNEIRVINSNGQWESTADGNYWYDVITQEWFGYNIMAPFQYSVFYPHTNTNTVRLPYNKGVTLLGTCQDNFIDRMRWGTVIHYGALQGNYAGELTRCIVSPGSFVSQVAHSSGVSGVYKLEGAVKLPTMTNVDVKGYTINVPSLIANLTDGQKTKLGEAGNRKVLHVVNSVPYVKYYSELGNGGSGGSADLTDYYTKEQIDDLLNNVVVEEKEVYVSSTEPTDADIWIDLSSTESVVPVEDAPNDGKQYARQNKQWSEVVIPEVDLSSYSTIEYTDTAIANLVDSAPETLNTLNELATAIQEHSDVTDALDAAITNKQDKGNYVIHNGGVSAILTMTQEEYDALEEVDPTVLYIILD